MANVTIAVGGLLILLGVGVFGGLYVTEGDKPSVTALIPAFAGVPILLLGLLAKKESMRKHAMHGVAALALIGFLLSAGRLAMQVVKGGPFNPVATGSLVGMAALCGYLTYACVSSFIAARKRQAAESESGAQYGTNTSEAP